MDRPYHQLLPAVFKRFSVTSALRTLPSTAAYYALRPSLPASDKPALFTMNILPPMLTVWHHCVRKYLGDGVDCVAFDCSGKVDPREVPGLRVHKFLNFYASAKCDEFLRRMARNRKTVWFCDDDVFLISKDALRIVQDEMGKPNTASVSFRPRGWWSFHLQGKTVDASGSYCVAVNRDIVWTKEHLSLAPADNNPHASGRRYDTFDRANEILLQKGYRCAVLPKATREQCITGFTGMSGAVMLLWHFRTPEELLGYYQAPEKKAWQGNTLPGTLSALLGVCAIQECYEELTGKKYPLPSLPPRATLEKLRDSHRKYMREDFTYFEEVAKETERLKDAL